VHVSPRSRRSMRAVHKVYQPARQFTTYIELSHSQRLTCSRRFYGKFL
jgi:hypothetical protein